MSRRGGAGARARSRRGSRCSKATFYELPNGVRLRGDRDTRGYVIRFEGERVDPEMVRTVLGEVYRMLSSRK